MKKALKVFSVAFAAMLLLFNVANAQRTYDTLSVRNFRYTTLQNTGVQIVLTDSLTSDSAAVLSDIREGCLAVGYKIVLDSVSTILTVDVRERSYYDGYLYILDSNFNEVNYNDDYTINGVSGSTCAGIVGRGTYYIIATMWSRDVDYGRNYAFTMTVTMEPTHYIARKLDDFSEMSFRTISSVTGVSEWIDSIAYGDTLFTIPYTYFTPTGEPFDMSDITTVGEQMLVAYRFTLTQNTAFRVGIYDTLDTIDAYAGYLYDSRFRAIDMVFGANLVNLEPGTYYFAVSTDSRHLHKLPMRYGIRAEFAECSDIQDLNYASITLPYTDTTECTSANPMIFDYDDYGNTMLRYLSGAYKIHMNADTLYRFYINPLDTNSLSNENEIVLMDSNFGRLNLSSNLGEQLYMEYMPLTSGDYYLMALYDTDADTLRLSFSASKTEMPVFYVDAVNGSDTSAGTTPARAFASLSKIQSMDTSAIVYIMSDMDISSVSSFDRVINIRGYQDKAYVMNGDENDIDVVGQLVIGGKNANDTLILMKTAFFVYGGASMVMFDDVEYTTGNESMYESIRNYGSLDIYGTKFHDIQNTANLISSVDAPHLTMKGVTMDKVNVGNSLLKLRGIRYRSYVIDSCTIENCTDDCFLRLGGSGLVMGKTTFNVSNTRVVRDTSSGSCISVGECVLNLKNFDMLNNLAESGWVNAESGIINLYSGNLKHNQFQDFGFLNGEIAQFNMFGGNIEDNVCLKGFLIGNELGGFCEFRGGSIRDNIGSIMGGDADILPGSTMRNYGGILSVIKSSITVSDSFLINNDAFIVTDSPVIIGSALQGENFATLVPIELPEFALLKSSSSDMLKFKYVEGYQVLGGDESLVRSQYFKFGLAQYDTITWYIDIHGRLTSTPVGLNTAEQATVKVYPNPTSDYVNIDANTVVAEGIILDMQGRVIAQQPMVSGSARINMQALANGVYFIQLLNDQHEVLATKKIIKK